MNSQIINKKSILRLEHAVRDKENALQQRDDMEIKLKDLIQQKYVK